jgi:hypothetical protein
VDLNKYLNKNNELGDYYGSSKTKKIKIKAGQAADAPKKFSAETDELSPMR